MEQFLHKCITNCHDIAKLLFEGSERFIATTNKHKFPSNKCQLLIKFNLIVQRPDRKQFVCEACIELAKNIRQESQVPETQKVVEYDSSLYIEELKTLSQADIAKVAACLGEMISSNLRKNSKCPIGQLTDESYESVWNKQNPILKSFLEGIVNKGVLSLQETRRKRRYLVKSVDAILSALRDYYVSPLSLSENLLMYQLTSSKLACNLLSKTQACGSYSTILKTIDKLSQNDITYPKGDIIVAFDNIQTMTRKYRVSLEAEFQTSVVTNVSIYQQVNPTQFQNKKKYTFVDYNSAVDLLTKYSQSLRPQLEDIHRKFRLDFIVKRFTKIIQECSITSGVVEDPVSKNDLTLENEREGLNYDRVPNGGNEFLTFTQECLLVNPNSYKTVATVMDDIMKKSQLSDPSRKWIVVVCDGSPYCIGRELLLNTYQCNLCQATINKTDKEDHSKIHNSAVISFKRKYESICLRAGNGHYEINLVRCIFNVYWEVYIKSVAVILGYKSEKAQQYCKSAHDHHKSWQILEILFEALTDEMTYTYVSTTLTQAKPTTEGYLDWLASHKSRNLRVASDFVYSVLHPLFLFRAATRRCNDLVALAAKEKVCGLFYGFSHPKYQILNASEIFHYLSLPDEIVKLAGIQSGRRLGHNYGQGFDFLLEEDNKDLKAMTTYSGVPTHGQWIKASRAMPQLKQVRLSTIKNLGLDLSSSRSRMSFAKEKMAVRKMLRNLNLFSTEDEVICSATETKEPLDEEFVNCIHRCEENRKLYYEAHLRNEKVTLKYVDVKKLSLNLKLQQKTKNEITMLIKERISKLSPYMQGIYTEHLKKSIKKDNLITLYHIIDEEIRDYEYLYDQLNLNDE